MRSSRKATASNRATSAEKQKKKFNTDMRMIRTTLNADPPTTAQQIESDIGRWGWRYGLGKNDILVMLQHVESRCAGKLDQPGREYLRTEINRLFDSVYEV